MSSEKSTPSLKHGAEPTNLLLAIAFSAIETLIGRGDAALYTANGSEGQPVVVVVFNHARISDGVVELANEG